MSENVTLQCEVIVNFPKVNTKSFTDDKTGKTTQYDKFTAQFLFSKDDSKTILNAIKGILSQNKGYSSSLRSMKDKVSKFENQLELNSDDKSLIETIKKYKELSKEYTHYHPVSSSMEYLECQDLYDEKLDAGNLKSGDKLYVKLSFVARMVKTPEGTKRLIQCFVNLITLLEKQSVELVSGVDNSAYFDSLQSYKDKYLDKAVLDIVSADEDLSEEDLPL